MKITVDDDAIDELTQKILTQQYKDLKKSYESTAPGPDHVVYSKVLAALRVVLAWNCTQEQCKKLDIEWTI